MNYEFPTIRHIDDLMPAIQGDDLFIVAEKEGYTVINYGKIVVPDMFPEVNREEYCIGGEPGRKIEEARLHRALRRECRGIIFDSKTGELIRRPYHKFFNVNERPETMKLDLTQEHIIFDKLDGSMIAPFFLDNKIIWGTKMGATDVAKPVMNFVGQYSNYNEMAYAMIAAGYTPIFEWCSRKQRIVLDYPTDNLVLTAIRHMETGAYSDISKLHKIGDMFEIPVAKTYDSYDNIDEFVEYTRALSDTEGFVIRFNDGHMAKIKCDWYCNLHKTLENLVFEKDVLYMILNETIDDAKAFLAPDIIEKLDNYAADIYNGLTEEIEFIKSEALNQWLLSNGDRKTFAQRTDGVCGRQLWFKALDFILKWEADATFDWHTAFNTYVIDYVKSQCGSQSKVDNIRWLIGGAKWNV